jgi:asparagine synthase (glutamine-hydrolysing)
VLARRIRTAGGLAILPAAERYDRLLRITSPLLEHDLLGNGGEPSAGYLARQMPGGVPAQRVDQLLRIDTLTYLPEDLLVKMDRATMAASLEARSPLLDQDMATFAAQLPTDRKLQGGRSKVLLREVARRLLPAPVVDLPKHGFGVPTDAWFRSSLGTHFEAVALAPDAFLRDILDHDVVARLYAEHRSRSMDHGHRLWQLLSLELWGRTWMRGATA